MTLESREIPMFPLGSVLLPRGVLPLHIFEPRYQLLLNHALEGDRTFGVVLISRGSEVGGGEVRTTIGTLARIEEHQRYDDGRATVIAVGTKRIEVLDWLSDDPYPRARVIDLLETEAAEGDAVLLAETRSKLDALLATAVDLGRLDRVPEIDWSTDTIDAIWQLATVAPIGQLDRQAILSDIEPGDRLSRLAGLIDGVHDDVRRLSDLDE